MESKSTIFDPLVVCPRCQITVPEKLGICPICRKPLNPAMIGRAKLEACFTRAMIACAVTSPFLCFGMAFPNERPPYVDEFQIVMLSLGGICILYQIVRFIILLFQGFDWGAQ